MKGVQKRVQKRRPLWFFPANIRALAQRIEKLPPTQRQINIGHLLKDVTPEKLRVAEGFVDFLERANAR